MKRIFLSLLVCLTLTACSTIKAEEKTQTQTVETEAEQKAYDFSDSSSENLTITAWELKAKKDYDGVFAYTSKCIELYGQEAEKQQSSLNNFALPGRESRYSFLNDVATCYFIKGEALMALGRLDEARIAFQTTIDKFGYAQCWDPRGWYWKVAEKAKINIEKIEKKKQELPAK